MSFFHSAIDFVLHINDHLDAMVAEYGTTIYVILFTILFVETGLVVMPFLPGDSLLFAAGAICARQSLLPNPAMNIFVLIILLFAAAVLGDCSNYAIGKFFGKHAVNWKIGKRKLLKQQYIDRTHSFFEKYGTKAIIMSRFVPIIRTFTPFVAGVGEMKFRMKFLPFDIIGGFLWVSTMALSGFFLGQNQWVSKHFESVVVIIIFISILPMIIGYLRYKFKKKTS